MTRSTFVLRLAFVGVASLSLAALAVVVARYINAIPILWMSDYLTYAAAGERAVAGLPLYPAFQLSGPYVLGDAAFGYGFIYPPTAGLLLVPLALITHFPGFLLLEVASVVGLVAVIHRIARREGLGRRGSALLALAYVVSPPTIEAVATGNVDLPLAVAVGLWWLYPRSSGYVSVLCSLIKVFPIAGLAWAWRCRAPILVPLVIGVGVGLLSLAIFGPPSWVDFALTMRNAENSYEDGIAAPRQVLGPLVGQATALVITLAATAALLLAAVRVKSDRLAIVLVALSMILPAPDWYTHYLLIPMVALAPYLASRAARWPAVWAALSSRSPASGSA